MAKGGYDMRQTQKVFLIYHSCYVPCPSPGSIEMRRKSLIARSLKFRNNRMEQQTDEVALIELLEKELLIGACEWSEQSPLLQLVLQPFDALSSL